MNLASAPDRSEAAEYYFIYIDQVDVGDIRETLASQAVDALTFLRGIPGPRTLDRYAPDKWSIRQVLCHVNDTERVFLLRALWFARRFETPLPGFDQNVGVANADADARSWESHVEEFRDVRNATLAFFRNLPADAWDRRGVASDRPFSVKALAFITAGHAAHHLRILRERYRV